MSLRAARVAAIHPRPMPLSGGKGPHGAGRPVVHWSRVASMDLHHLAAVPPVNTQMSSICPQPRAQHTYRHPNVSVVRTGDTTPTSAIYQTPCTRPAILDPTNPKVINQLHLTRWTSDLSSDDEAGQAARLL
ncbi:hypothetical protein PCANC_13479 [Puccinia coronata f. sp. avenae]|uniref:Uncharacterized protein n=1 Tax=Puccinia coronata f. sp. avenae TaxID=200324 RepID=A0A2N5V4P1_9BASI|nr:hypothetical protein PCANC_13479 [Puccinia coronata f. sp. avenae]